MGKTREEILAAATAAHDKVPHQCQRKYLMSCRHMAAAVLAQGTAPCTHQFTAPEPEGYRRPRCTSCGKVYERGMWR